MTFHLVAPDPQFLYKLTLLVVPGAAGDTTGQDHLALPGHRALPDRVLQPRGQASSPSPATSTSSSGRLRRSRTASSTASPGSRWPTPTRRRTPCSKGERTWRSSLRSARGARRRGRSWTRSGSRRRAASTAASRRDRVRRAQLLHPALRQPPGAPGVQLRGRPDEGRRAPGWSVRWPSDLPARPPSMPSYRALLPLHPGPPDGAYHGPDLAKARDLVRGPAPMA